MFKKLKHRFILTNMAMLSAVLLLSFAAVYLITAHQMQNQKKMLEDYANANGFTNCVHFTDDGWSGGSFDRPS